MGYITIQRGGHSVLEHRFIAEQMLGRKLKRSEHVHHLNRVPRDNRPENLVVVSPKKHRDIHRKDGHVPFQTYVCETCSRKFKRRVGVVAKHCSMKCRMLWNRNHICLNCGVKFTRRDRHNKISRFCTCKCSNEYNSQRAIRDLTGRFA